MKDSKITKKLHPSGSLAIRVLFVAIVLLVLPLFFQSYFLYQQEYRDKLTDVKEDLKLIVEERVHLIEELIQRDWALLDAWSVPQNVGFRSGPIQRIPLPNSVGEHFLLVSMSEKALLVGRAEFDRSALVIPIPFRIVGGGLNKEYPARVAILSDNGTLVWENRQRDDAEEYLQEEMPILQTDLKLRVEVEQSAIDALHRKSYYLRFASLFFFVGIIGGGIVYFFTKRISKPLKQLTKVMQRVAQGAAHVRYEPDWMGFEINALGLGFNKALDHVLLHEEEVRKERLKREMLSQELQIGHEIQESLLPSHMTGARGLDLCAKYFSAKEVNGDFYDLIELENGNLLITICDTAGKGISACLFSLGLRSILRSLASVTTDLSDLICKANEIYMQDAHESSMFSTLWVGIYDPDTKELNYCSQGHPPAYLIRDNILQELWTQGIALGAQGLDVIETKTTILKEEDILVLYTDGVIEAHNEQEELFGKNRLETLLEKGPFHTASELGEKIIEKVHLFSAKAAQHDDITLLVLRVIKEY